jgi:hypothetical protein
MCLAFFIHNIAHPSAQRPTARFVPGRATPSPWGEGRKAKVWQWYVVEALLPCGEARKVEAVVALVRRGRGNVLGERLWIERSRHLRTLQRFT